MSFLSAEEHVRLLAIARESLASHLSGTQPAATAADTSDTGRLAESHAAFVTLIEHEQLRGCIGTLAPERPLPQLIASLAVAAATRDPRFPPVDASELSDLRIEISVLTPAAPIRAEDIVIGTHGLVIERGHHRGLLLPQVAPEHNFDVPRFLAAVCMKAGLPPDAWRDPAAQLSGFTAEVFAE